jgi:hypothetical protein
MDLAILARIRDHGEFSMGDALESLNGMFKADKIVVTQNDENGRLDRSQIFVRKSGPGNCDHLAPNPRPRIRIGRDFLVLFFLKMRAPGVASRQAAPATPPI